jgi:hypothetical protein
MDEGRRYGLHEGLCHRVEGCREGHQSEARRLHEYGIHGLPQVGMENHLEYSVPGLWVSRSAEPVFQRYTRLKADYLRFEGELL